MKKFFSLVIVCCVALTASAQKKYFTKKAKVSFYAESPAEKIEAHNSRGTSVMDASTGALEFSVLISGFEFEKAKMQEHFNESYLESAKFPKATFKGKITDMTAVDLKKDGDYTVTVEGDLTIHGKTKKISTKATISVKGGKISASCTFSILLKDYDVKPASGMGEDVKLVVKVAEYEELKKK
jgi:polyisoprenoid-binding protein YceI